MQHPYYLQIACTEKWSSQGGTNSRELSFQNSYCLTIHVSWSSNASWFLCTTKSWNSGNAQARSSFLAFQTSSLGNPCLHKTEIVSLEASSQIPGIWHYTYVVQLTATLKYRIIFYFQIWLEDRWEFLSPYTFILISSIITAYLCCIQRIYAPNSLPKVHLFLEVVTFLKKPFEFRFFFKNR